MSAHVPTAEDFVDAVACLVTEHWNPQAKEPNPLDLIILKRGQTLHFGRNKNSDVYLSEANVSHNHFELTHNSTNDEIVLKDVSKRGTFVNGHKLEKSTATLQEGDKIKVEKHVWNLTNSADIEKLLNTSNGEGKVKNSLVAPKNQNLDNLEDSVTMGDELMDSPKPKGGILSTPLGKIRGIFSPRRSSSAVNSRVVEYDDEENMNNSLVSSGVKDENNKRSPRFRRNSNISSELEAEIEHKAKKQPASSSKVSKTTYRKVTTNNVNGKVVVSEQNITKEETDETSAASLIVSSNRKIRDIYSNVLEANSNKDVPTLEDLTTDTIHSVIKCAADANEGFQNDLNAVMEKQAGLAVQISEANALYDAVSAGKGFPFASGRILKERVRYCAQLEARLKEHQMLYESLLKSRDLMVKKLESVHISCGVARSIVAEYKRLYESVYARINTEIPRPNLDREAPTSLIYQKITLSPKEVEEITRAINLGTNEEVDELLNNNDNNDNNNNNSSSN